MFPVPPSPVCYTGARPLQTPASGLDRESGSGYTFSPSWEDAGVEPGASAPSHGMQTMRNSDRMRRSSALALLLAAGLLSGCVERHFFITSEPPGATVYREGMQLGVTPVDDPFVYYGTREYKLVLDGFEPLTVKQPAPPPWYEIPPLDFVAENLWPFKIRDVRRPEPYQLQPLQTPNPNQVLDRGQQLRNTGRGIGDQPASPPAPSSPPAELPR